MIGNVKSLIKKALKNIFKKKVPSVDPDLFQIAFDTLDHAIGTAQIEYNKPNFLFTKMLRESAAMFSAKKTYAQAKELAAIAASKPGYQITWKEFLEKARPIVKDYNENWLKTEYNTAIRKARQAAQWDRYYEQKHLYPNLKYLPSRAATPRKEHKPYYFVVRPVDDNFWVHHTPPIDWNCLCGIEQTDEAVTPLPEKGPAPTPGLDSNPALTGELFSDDHPYDSYTREAQEEIRRRAIELKVKRDYEVLIQNHEFEYAFESIKHLMPDYQQLNQHQIGAIRWYTGNGYYELNRWKRKERRGSRLLSAFADTLNSALDKLPSYSGTVYRGADLPKKLIQEYKDALQNNNSIKHNYFTSTAKDPGAAFSKNVLFTIQTKNGKDVEMISPYTDSEKEVLIKSGTEFQVLDIVESQNRVEIWLREL